MNHNQQEESLSLSTGCSTTACGGDDDDDDSFFGFGMFKKLSCASSEQTNNKTVTSYVATARVTAITTVAAKFCSKFVARDSKERQR